MIPQVVVLYLNPLFKQKQLSQFRYAKQQDEILEKLSSEGFVFWCKNLKDLAKFITMASSVELRQYKAEPCNIHSTIIRYLNDQITK